MKPELLTSEEMKLAEEAAISEGITEEVLMERAGEGVAEVIRSKFDPCSTVIVCGPGKNGGDGQVVARLLKKAGWVVHVISFKDLPSHEDIQK